MASSVACVSWDCSIVSVGDRVEVQYEGFVIVSCIEGEKKKQNYKDYTFQDPLYHQARATDPRSSIVCVTWGCSIVSVGVPVGVLYKRFGMASCIVYVGQGCCIVSDGVPVGVQ